MKKRQLFLIVLLAVAAVALVACGGNEAAPAEINPDEETQTVPVAGGGSYTDVSVAGLAALMEEEEFPLINVHIPYEGEIEDTDLFIPYNEIEQHLDQLPADKDARIVLYCRSGSMSAQAAQKLVNLGYTDLWNLDGGMIAWRNAGRTLLNQ